MVEIRDTGVTRDGEWERSQLRDMAFALQSLESHQRSLSSRVVKSFLCLDDDSSNCMEERWS